MGEIMNDQVKHAAAPAARVEINSQMFALINSTLGYCAVKVIRDVTDEEWCTTPRLEEERVYEVQYAAGDFLGQYTQVAARHLSSSYPSTDASVELVGTPGPVIKHGQTENMIYGPYYVLLIRGDRVGASVSGIRTPEACEERAAQYSRAYGAPIVTPSLLSGGASHEG
jgi:hypothetical protein